MYTKMFLEGIEEETHIEEVLEKEFTLGKRSLETFGALGDDRTNISLLNGNNNAINSLVSSFRKEFF